MNLIKWKLLNPQKQKKKNKKPHKMQNTAICNTHVSVRKRTIPPFYIPVDLKALSRVN